MLLDLQEKQPSNVDVLLELGALYLARHESAKGIEFLRRAVDQAPLNDRAIERLANALFGTGDHEEALALLNEFRNQSRQYSRAHRVLAATIAEHTGDYAEALSLYESLLEEPESTVSDQLLVASALGY